MTAQTPESATALQTRLQPRFDDTPRTTQIETVAGRAGWPGGKFGDPITDVMTLVVHGTDGWPTRTKTNEFASRYTDPHHLPAHDRGIGPHFYIPLDGTVFRLLSENLLSSHAEFINDRAIGVETGNITVSPGPHGAGHWLISTWTALSRAAEDLPGVKFYASSQGGEVLITQWTVGTPVVPANAHIDGRVMMLFSEAQYAAWGVLARWLTEAWRIPRNFPLRPHVRRDDHWQKTRWLHYREAVDADVMRDAYIRTQLQPAPINCNAATFASNDPATGLPHVYARGVTSVMVPSQPPDPPHPKGVNKVWTTMFDSYRGIIAHAYSGSLKYEDHNCPGAWFDWHRFARMVWDWWWYPCDLSQATPSDAVVPVTARRDYGVHDAKLYEHYFDEDHSLFAKVTTHGFYPLGEETVTPHVVATQLTVVDSTVRMWHRYWGFWHGGMHFELDEASPIYAIAAGQVVAARLGPVAGDFDRTDKSSPLPSALFVLLRHEVFWQRAAGDRINYNAEPTRVYSLYMHVGQSSTLSFVKVVADNPTWLNRVIAIKKEYDLGRAFNGAHPAPADQWAPLLARWSRRQPVFDQLLTDLQNGKIVRFPEGEDAVQVELGDFLGIAGHLDVDKSGIHLEVFSAEQIKDPWFEALDKGGSASRPFHDDQNLDDVTGFIETHLKAPPGGKFPADTYRALGAEHKASTFQNLALRSKSEWALEAGDFPTGGWQISKDLMWWSSVVPGMNAALSAAADHLPTDAVVWHYHPLGFMSWLNDITWKSEWPKYRVEDASGAPVPAPARPPARR